MKALILSPTDGTDILNNANTLAKTIHETLAKENFDVTFIGGADVLRKNLPKKRFEVIVFAGHGESDKLLGSDSRAIFTDTNADYFDGAVVISIACGSCAWLGLSAVSKGARAYIGFDDIVYVASAKPEYNYLGDFVRTLMVLPLGLLAGYSVYQAMLDFRELCVEYSVNYTMKKPEPLWETYYAWMRHNGASVSFEGNPSTRLGDRSLVVRCGVPE